MTVAVNARPVDGEANRAVLTAVAKAFGLRPRHVEVVGGATSRTKVIRLDGDPEHLTRRLEELLG